MRATRPQCAPTVAMLINLTLLAILICVATPALATTSPTTTLPTRRPSTLPTQQPIDCASLDITTCSRTVGCAVDVNSSVERCVVAETGSCNVILDFTIPFPFNCPQDQCVIRTLANKNEYCDTRSFRDSFQTFYWGQSGFPIGYLLWNLILGLSVVGMLRIVPRLLGYLAAKVSKLSHVHESETSFCTCTSRNFCAM
jgi:hypothetical protein